MNIILLTKSGGKPVSKQLSSTLHFAVLGLLLSSFCATLVYAGFWMGSNQDPNAYISKWNRELQLQRGELERVREQSRADVEALTQRLGQMQGYVSRLDALGLKLVKMAKLDVGEFNFGQAPGLGGPEITDEFTSESVVPELRLAITELATQLEARDNQLSVLEQLIMERNLEAEVFPSGRPVKVGWLSSSWGMRSSPFSGQMQFHKGIDFAGREGQEILAIAGGVITYSGDRYGYGNLVEINHGNGYSTRYAHNKDLMVQEGDPVKKGQVIATMGSTGRSTGFHVHLEVLKDGRQINPTQFILTSN